jgi:hypothetical protein
VRSSQRRQLEIVRRFGAIGRLKPAFDRARQQELHEASMRCETARFSRYSPASTRSTSNCCPGSMPSCRRNSAGSTICPLLETRVRMDVRYRLPALVKVRDDRGGRATLLRQARRLPTLEAMLPLNMV